jgi:propionate CoA-transferase
MRNKLVSVQQAVELLRDGDTLCIGGFGSHGVPEALLQGLEQRFVESGGPKQLTLLFGVATGNFSDSPCGSNHLAHEGLLKRVVGAHFAAAPLLGKLLMSSAVEAYNLPLGVISQLYRDMAAGLPGRATKVGLGTFVDPRLEGGKVNPHTVDDIVSVIELAGEPMLFYRALPISVAFIRGTAADPEGNLVMDRESMTLDTLAIAMAAKNHGGLVIAQVEYVADSGSLGARRVKVPGTMVDCIVVAPPGQHPQSLATPHYNFAYSAEARVPLGQTEAMAIDERKIIARRAAFELVPNAVVNLGVGMPEGVAGVANEEKIVRYMTLTTEPGVIGGVPVSGAAFGTALNADVVIDMDRQFDYYDGGGLDLTCLGLAQCDAAGNVNVSRFGPRLAGAGGFINISQGARKVVFAGTFTAGGLEVAVEQGRLRIVREGRSRKFLQRVEQVTFSAAQAVARKVPVLYVTERCVFRLSARGLELAEVAPGVDIGRDILAQMDFEPIVGDPVEMDPRIFRDEPMGLKEMLLSVKLADRFIYDPGRDTMFMNFEGLKIRTPQDIDAVRDAIEQRFGAIGKKASVVANYDGFELDEDLVDAWAAAAQALSERHYRNVSRYTTSAFMRLKLGEALVARGVQPHLFETQREAMDFAGKWRK